MKKVTIAIILLALLTGCSKTLSRGKAKDIISEYNHYDKPSPVEFHPTQDELAEGKKKGFWTSDEVTLSGRKFFELGGACRCITTVAKVRPEIEVTGIFGDESEKKVEYTIDWFADLPSEVKDICKDHLKPRPDSVIMRLYDDGWRVVR